MCWLAVTAQAGATFGTTGKFAITDPAGSFFYVPLPSGVASVDMRPSFALYNGEAISRTYMVGGWTDNLVLTENFTLARMGIISPINPIVNAAGSGLNVGVVASTGPGATGNAICYLRWRDDLNARRSPLSDGSPTFALANQARTWNNLPTDPGDTSVTSIEGWVSMDGGLPRFAWRRDLGVTSVVENLATALLGEAETESLDRFPRCRFNVLWNSRQVMAGDDRHPDRLYLSPLNDPENYGGFFLRTPKGERIIGLISMRRQLIILCATSSYVVEGYTEDDIAVNILEPEIGGISHFAVAPADGWAFVPSHRGLYLCTGSSFHNISKEFEKSWRREYREARFDDDAQRFEDAWAVNDLETNSYKLHTGESTLIPADKNGYWVLDYSDLLQETGGSFAQPSLSFDVRTRRDMCAAVLKVPGGRGGELYVGSSDGIVRQENVDDDDDDDGDTYKKRAVFQTPHYFPVGPGGSEEDAAKYLYAWACVRSETRPYSIIMYPGDESAVEMDENDYKVESVSAGAADEGGDDLVAKCVHLFRPMIAGRGMSFRIDIESPKAGYDDGGELNTYIAGLGFTFDPGQNQRRRAAFEEVQP